MLQKKERITKKSWQSRQQMLRENNEQKQIIKKKKHGIKRGNREG